MTLFFADTFYWVALTNRRDRHNQTAQKYDKELSNSIILTTDEVIIEFLNFFSKKSILRIHAGQTLLLLQKLPNVKIIPQSRASFDSGFELYRTRSDKGYSLTDCISMQTMWQEDITDVLTNDRHFEQEGFRALFRD